MLISAQGTPVVSGDASKVARGFADVQTQNHHTLLQGRIVAAVPVLENGIIKGVRAWGADGGEFDFGVGDQLTVQHPMNNVTAVVVGVNGGAVLLCNATGGIGRDSLAKIVPDNEQTIVPLSSNNDPSFYDKSIRLRDALTDMSATLRQDPSRPASDFVTVLG